MAMLNGGNEQRYNLYGLERIKKELLEEAATRKYYADLIYNEYITDSSMVKFDMHDRIDRNLYSNLVASKENIEFILNHKQEIFENFTTNEINQLIPSFETRFYRAGISVDTLSQVTQDLSHERGAQLEKLTVACNVHFNSTMKSMSTPYPEEVLNGGLDIVKDAMESGYRNKSLHAQDVLTMIRTNPYSEQTKAYVDEFMYHASKDAERNIKYIMEHKDEVFKSFDVDELNHAIGSFGTQIKNEMSKVGLTVSPETAKVIESKNIALGNLQSVYRDYRFDKSVEQEQPSRNVNSIEFMLDRAKEEYAKNPNSVEAEGACVRLLRTKEQLTNNFNENPNKENFESLRKFNESSKEFEDKFTNNKNLMIGVVEKNPSFFKYASEELRNDADVVSIAMDKDIKNYLYVGDKIKSELSNENENDRGPIVRKIELGD